MAGRVWGVSEDALLRKFWEEGRSVEEITVDLPGRSEDAIRVRAKRLQLRHTPEQTAAILSKLVSGTRNGMSGQPGPRRGVRLTPEARTHLRDVALIGFAEGHRKPLHGAQNPAFGKPGTMLGKTLSPAAKETLSEKGKARWNVKSSEEKQLKIEQLRKGWSALGKQKPSKIEVLVGEWLTTMQTPFETQVVLDFYVVDFLCKMKIVEVHGDYWHANPVHYNNPSAWTPAQRANVRRDKAKFTSLTRRGYEVLVLWEHDIHHRPLWCKEQMLNFLGSGDGSFRVEKP